MKHLLTILCLFLTFTMWGQSINDLKKQLSEAETSQERMVLNYQIAKAYVARGDGKEAYDYAQKAYQLANEKRNYSMAAQSAFLKGKAYLRERDPRNADVWFSSAIKSAKRANDPDLIIKSVNERSRLAVKKREYRRAYEIHQEVFDYFTKRGDRSISDMDSQYEVLKSQLEKQKRQLEREKRDLEDEITRLSREKGQLREDKADLEQKQEKLVKEKRKVENEIERKEEELENVAEAKKEAEARVKRREATIKTLNREALEKEALLAEAELEKTKAELQQAEAERVITQSRNLQILMLVVGAFLTILVLLFYLLYRSSAKRKKALEEKNHQIREQEERSNELLLNILPANIADELKATGKAKTQRYNYATVLFLDFRNFSRIAEGLPPEKLIEELDRNFREFDRIISEYGGSIEKIKTIGDAYMCASGLVQRRTIPTDIVNAALQMQEFLEQEKERKRRLGNPHYFEARIGIHTGPVVAGVVGLRKFAYDIWGDTVNIAARMEENCEVGGVNISETTYRLIKYKFHCIPRGKVPAKNKGLIEMFYVKQTVSV